MSRGTAKSDSGTILPCVVLTSGALFGAAALALLQHFRLDFPAVRSDLLIGEGFPLRPGLAWWAWWLVGGLAFMIGRLGAGLARRLVAYHRLLPGLRSPCTVAAILALAAVGYLLAARTGIAATSQAVFAFAVLMLATGLAALGAGTAPDGRGTTAAATRQRCWRNGASGPVNNLPPVLHDGSVYAGLPYLAVRRRPRLAGAATISMRGAAAATATAIAIAGISAVASSSVLLQQNSPQTLRASVKSKPSAVAGHPITIDAPEASARETVGVSPDMPISPPPAPVSQAAAVVGAFAMVTPDEKELTFAKGYARRRAALEASGIMPVPPRVRAVPAPRHVGAVAPRADRHDRADRIKTYDFQRTFGGG